MVVAAFRNRMAPGIDEQEYGLRAARRGRKKYDSEYHLQICDLVRESHKQPGAR